MAARVLEDSVVTCESVTVDFGGVLALDDVSCAVERGQWVGLIGPNGAGKTTLLRVLAGLVALRGSVQVEGESTASLSRRHFARRVAYVPQSPSFPPAMRAVDYVVLGRTPHLGYFGTEGTHDRDVAHELLARLALESMADRLLEALSGGELQRLVLARALAQEATLLLLDEPTSALDVARRVEALELVDELRRERGLTVISAMHDLSLAGQFADRLLLLAGGRLVADGTPEQVLDATLLDRHFGASVEVLRSDDGELIVVPRRLRPRGRP